MMWDSEHWYNLIITVVGFLSILFKQNSSIKDRKKQQNSIEDLINNLQIDVKRIELNQAIDHDFGSKIVIELLDEYHALGGNSYMSIKAEKYILEKGDFTHGN